MMPTSGFGDASFCPRTHGDHFRLLAILLFVAPAAGVEPTAKPAPHLLFLHSDYEGLEAHALRQCERLTMERYRQSGARVTEITPADRARWLETDGHTYSKAHKYFQYLGIAKAKGADAVGGLTALTIAPEESADYETDPGVYFYGWGISLSNCSHNFVINLTGKAEVRPIPLFQAEGESWEVSTTMNVRAETFGSGAPASKAPDSQEMFSPNRGRPFLGVSIKANKVTSVLPDSPAEAAGVRTGDTLLSLNGQKIEDLGSVAETLRPLSPGTEVELAYEHEGHVVTKRVKLADYHELVEVKLAPVGKPLPDLKGVDIDGHDVALSRLRGKVVLLDFWATWCGPCLEELPLLQLLWEKMKDKGFVWVSVSTDEDPEVWRAFVRDNRLGGIQVRNPEWAAKMYVSGFPTILLVDRAGVVRAELRGDAIAAAVAALIAKD